ncbi:uncharacterized protein BYT42DRAFT_561720 [Radiomyces spectabilis]|uniref:uncharacterized protein n=1 Tax=Radiomyces spectabilis TaxID=64574 RepID=UPI00221E6120|nr:uncharacterized protein BYT42DRAFT_561720 [Radiomyces spectabilis]KAI8388932.1 hypothetical protein BYT42DRAFT_561720 [Radiomyces spectabilis]
MEYECPCGDCRQTFRKWISLRGHALRKHGHPLPKSPPATPQEASVTPSSSGSVTATVLSSLAPQESEAHQAGPLTSPSASSPPSSPLPSPSSPRASSTTSRSSSPTPALSLPPLPPPPYYTRVPPTCLVCNRRFQRPSGVYQHLRLVHSIDVEIPNAPESERGRAAAQRRYVAARRERLAAVRQQQQQQHYRGREERRDCQAQRSRDDGHENVDSQ